MLFEYTLKRYLQAVAIHLEHVLWFFISNADEIRVGIAKKQVPQEVKASRQAQQELRQQPKIATIANWPCYPPSQLSEI
jgi:hypothetical protein